MPPTPPKSGNKEKRVNDMFETANKKSSATTTVTKPKGLSFDNVQIHYNSDAPAQRMEFDEEEELLQGKFDVAQRVEFDEEEELLQGKFSNTAQRAAEVERPNLTGIPNTMKTQFENTSGFSFDDVRVHYNSDKPAQLSALAYTQGNQVHIAPGQEKYLGHELGHVVQQKLGIVKPTTSIGGVAVNDDVGLERMANGFSHVASFFKNTDISLKQNVTQRHIKSEVVQKVDWPGMTVGAELEISGLSLAISDRAPDKCGEIQDQSGNALWDVTTDMGNQFYTDAWLGKVELISTPVAQTDELGILHRKNSYKCFKKHVNADVRRLSELKNELDRQGSGKFSTLNVPAQYHIQNCNIDRYKLHKTTTDKHAIIKDNDEIGRFFMQLTAGATLEQTFTNLNIPWLNKNYHTEPLFVEILTDYRITGELADLCGKVYSYMASLAEKEAEVMILSQGQDLTNPVSKNRWGILPKTPKTEILKMIINDILRMKISNLIKYRDPTLTEIMQDKSTTEQALYKQHYQQYALIDMKAGKLCTADTINGKKTMLFEDRSPTDHTLMSGMDSKWRY
jgi:hypothetical protein